MAAQDTNLQLDSDFTAATYVPFAAPQGVDVTGVATGGAVTTINGDAGAGANGPVVSLTGGVTGFGFTATGASVTMTLDSAATVLSLLGLSKNHVDTVDPTVTDDSSVGFAINSLWTNTTGPKSYICQDATISNAVWQLLS